MNQTTLGESSTLINNLIHEIETVVKGKRNEIELVITTLLARGHVLIEDNPGTGKTILARSLAHAISGYNNSQGIEFKRVQFTPDLLPMDLIGAHIFDEKNHDFIFKKGPLFTNILLADEINRASPKVQSALLECMAEQQITVGDTTYLLEKLFFTIATQNPIETEGTYPLPSAQLDRFFMKLYFGYADEDSELSIYENYLDINKNLHTINQVITLDELLNLQYLCDQVTIHNELVKSVNNLIRNTRTHHDIILGASTRSGIALIKCLKAFALIKGRTYVIEDDLLAITSHVLHHRLLFKHKEGKLNALPSIINQEIKRLSKLRLQ